MASGLLSAELAATCNALGYFDGQKYHLEPHCKETVKDLIRYLRRDEDSHDIRRYLGNAKLVQTDLIPIIQTCSGDKELFDIILRLSVNLTNPALLVYNEVIPKDKTDHNQYLEIISHLQSYKEAFTDHKPWIAITERLSELLNIEVSERDDDTQRSIERILILVRNILHIPANATNENRPDNDASVHDQVVWAIHQSGMLDMILYIASSSQESNFYMHILEVVCLMLREQPPSLLGQTAAQRSVEEKERDDQELLKLRLTEFKTRQSKIKKYQGARHSNFGGTFVVKNMKSTSDNDIIYHKPLHTVNHITLDSEKKKLKTPKNRMALKSGNVERRSALSVRLIMKQFCVEILNAAYNPLMKHVKDFLVRGKTQDNDESYYFTALKFFMEFNRSYNFEVKLVSETMSVETFHFIQKYLETWHEMMVTDKNKAVLWSSRMHIALKAYKELLQNLLQMDASSDPSVRESSRVIKSNIFYVLEYREMLLVLINTYKKTKYSDQYLKDLMETVHIFLKILEHFGKNKKIFVQKKVRNAARNKKKSKPRQQTPNVEPPEVQWERLSSELSAVLQSQVTMEVIPFDPISDKTMDEQKIDAVKKIQRLLRSGSLQESVAYFRASREVWPENDSFGSATMSSDEELACLKEVFLADLQIEPEPVVEEVESSEADDEEEEELYPQISEQSFDVKEFLHRFASPKVISICCTLLRSFKSNSTFTNHVIAKMLHRVAWDCKYHVMLFQASLFRQFQKILSSSDSKYKELAKLAVYVIRKFVELAATNKKIYMEMLFLKSSKEAYDIENGYGTYEEKSKASKAAWEDHEEDELRRLYGEYERDKPGGDVVDWIMENMINKDRSKRSVKKKLKELYLLVDKPKTDKRWTEEQKQELITLFQEYRESNDVVGSIMERLSTPRSRVNVIKTILGMGLVEDRKELRKKRISKKGNKSRGMEDNSRDSGNSGSSSESDSDSSDSEVIEAPRVRPEPSLHLANAFITLQRQFNQHPYLEGGLRWVCSCLEETLEDLDDSEEAEVPLLPLSEDSVKSIDNRPFQQYLSSLGVYSPFKDQEVYWRFPANWKEEQLQSRLELTKFIVENFTKDISELSKVVNPLMSAVVGTSVNLMDFLAEDNKSDSEEETPGSFNDIIAKHCRETISGISNGGEDSLNQSRAMGYGSEDDLPKKTKKGKRKDDGGETSAESEVESNSVKSKLKKLARKKRQAKERRRSSSQEGTDKENSATKGASNQKRAVLSSTSSEDEQTQSPSTRVKGKRSLQNGSTSEEDNKSQSDSEVTKSSSKSKRKNKTCKRTHTSDHSSQEDHKSPNKSRNLKSSDESSNENESSRKRRIKITSGGSSDEEEVSDKRVYDDHQNSENIPSDETRKRQRVILDESSEEDEASKQETKQLNNEKVQSQKRNRLSYDSEEDESETVSKIKRKFNVIESDGDD